jgi:deoxycytidylate deaminase
MIAINSLIKMAEDLSQKAEHKRCKMVAIIFDGKRIVSWGVNKALSWKRNVPLKYKKWPDSIHAEVDCIAKAKGKSLKGKSIFVVRFKKDGLGMARPCKFCMAYINYVGISNVYYTNDLGEIEREEL